MLLMEPLPGVNKAYSLVLRVEKQREVNQIYDKVSSQENSAFFARMQPNTTGRGRGGNQIRGRGRSKGRGNDKNTRHCDYCNMSGHVRETCFQLNGYPEWYHQYKDQKE